MPTRQIQDGTNVLVRRAKPIRTTPRMRLEQLIRLHPNRWHEESIIAARNASLCCRKQDADAVDWEAFLDACTEDVRVLRAKFGWRDGDVIVPKLRK